ncbi:arginine decarboxylase, pyruvoyl-dependent [Candidatus Woesearchaeota archaeon]|nr:arginine decarboxylase, pyruvoyl-dependent [Candidatus Woesearchaeota archaeon]
MIPKYVFFTKGVGRSKEKLESFEDALRDAGIGKYNLVNVSSILPPKCKIISEKEGLKKLKPGQIIYVVMARHEIKEPKRLISASIGAAIPKDKKHFGYLSEHHSFGKTRKQTGDYAEDLAATMLATRLGIKFDVKKHWDERKKIYKLSGKIFRMQNTTQIAKGKKGLWTSVIAVAVFIP